MKKTLHTITFLAFSVLVFFIATTPKIASATWVYTSHSIPYSVTATPPPVITVNITANPASMTLPTNQTVLTWTTTGTPDSCSAFASWSGLKAAAGGSETMSGLSAGSYSYQIVCFKAGSANASDQVTVVVNSQNQNSITATLTANPSAFPFGGGTTTLAWGSTNANSCTGAGFNTNGATAGTTQASLTMTTTYTVTCVGQAGSAQAQATVIVLPISPGDGGGGDNPPPKAECADGKDNDGDLWIDINDPSCHTDCNATNTASYKSTLTTEAKKCIRPVYIEG